MIRCLLKLKWFILVIFLFLISIVISENTRELLKKIVDKADIKDLLGFSFVVLLLFTCIIHNGVESNKVHDISDCDLYIVSIKLNHIRKVILTNADNRDVNRQIILNNVLDLSDGFLDVVNFSISQNHQDMELLVL